KLSDRCAKSRFSPCQPSTFLKTLPTALRPLRRERASATCLISTPGSHRQCWSTSLEKVQRSNRRMKDYGPQNGLTSTVTSITETSSNSHWTQDGFPSISLFLSPSWWVLSITHIP